MVAQFANLNRLLEQGAEPKGRRTGQGERSSPTGRNFDAGEVLGAELQFSNGYKVLAVQIKGQKAVIKGPEAWLNFYKAMKDGTVQDVVGKWLDMLAKDSHNETVTSQASEAKPHEPEPDRVEALEQDVTSLKEGMEQILGILKGKQN